jgi:hypothetical protein
MQEGNVHRCYSEDVKRNLMDNWNKVVGIAASFVCFQKHWSVPAALECFLLAKVLLRFFRNVCSDTENHSRFLPQLYFVMVPVVLIFCVSFGRDFYN